MASPPNIFIPAAPAAITPAPIPRSFLVSLVVSTTSATFFAANAAGGAADVAKAIVAAAPAAFWRVCSITHILFRNGAIFF